MLNKIIEIVEDNITTSPKELPNILERETGYPNRQLAEAFSMLTNISIKSYHTIRRLEYAAQKLINGQNESIADLAQEVCYNDQAAFSNAFKKQFNLTPSEAKSGNIVTRGKMKINFSIDWGDEVISKQEQVQSENTFFGLSEMKFDEVQKLLGLAAFYGMNSVQANIAYEISKKTKIDFDSAFEFLNDYLELCTWDTTEYSKSGVKYFDPDLSESYSISLEDIPAEYINLYKNFSLLPTESYRLIESYYKYYNGIDIEKITQKHIDLYRIDDYNCDASEIEKIIEEASKKKGFDWEDFIEWLSENGIASDSVYWYSVEMNDNDYDISDDYDEPYTTKYEYMELYPDENPDEDYRPFDYFGDDEEVDDEVDGELAGLSYMDDDYN